MRIAVGALPLVLAMAACAAQPPPNWASGGSPLEIPRARWTRGSEHLFDIMPDGKVLADGEHVFTIDRAGRIYEPDNDPVAVLQADGRVLGKDEAMLGKIGIRNASPPGREIAWLTVGERGEVVHFDEEGDPHPDGYFQGCGPAVRTCTLAAHMVTLVEARRRSRRGYYGPPIGIGIGFGMVVAP